MKTALIKSYFQTALLLFSGYLLILATLVIFYKH